MLKEQLSELNSSLELYQSNRVDSLLPMIPVSLRDTKSLNLGQPLKVVLEAHYFEAFSAHEESIAMLEDMRESVRTPSRSHEGISLLFRYYNQLKFLEKRFFTSDGTCKGLQFTW